MKTSVVVGLSYGDEGKGAVTASLVEDALNPMVIRYSGGHQAGHTVVKDGHRHVFSSFGSGTLHGAPTYWSKFCTVYPTALLNEFELLKEFNPVLYIDPMCPITTPFDVLSNQITTKHGSVGVGFGETIKRNKNHYTLFAKDLKYKSVLEFKLENIKAYYNIIGYGEQTRMFIEDIKTMLSFTKNIIIGSNPKHNGDLIFEGAQGILLDQKFGFFPFCTPSNTTSKNVFKLIKRPDQIYMVTRAYQTRHGKGPMTNEHLPLELKNNEQETNTFNKFQENFRTAPFDEDILKYAIECEETVSPGVPKVLVMTCCDQVKEIPVLNLKYPTIYSYSPESIKLFA